MSEEKCCCNCLHCARWNTSKGIECHCDLTDRYLGYLEVMDTDNNCCRWEKETKWDLEKEHDAKVRADAIDEFKQALKQELNKYDFWIYEIADSDGYTLETSCDRDYLIDEVAEQLKENK